jgi:hypothetical protein
MGRVLYVIIHIVGASSSLYIARYRVRRSLLLLIMNETICGIYLCNTREPGMAEKQGLSCADEPYGENPTQVNFRPPDVS